HWCYLSQKKEQPDCEDPRHWDVVSANCKGNKQSPINIVTKNVIYDSSLKPLYFEGYDVKESSKWKIENNGHTGKYLTLSTNPKIGGGGLNGKYKAVEFHLHWGSQETPLYFPGSEHSIDGEKQAMELHIVHIIEDALDLADAKNYVDGIAVLAFFIKIDEENKNYATLISELHNIPVKDTSSTMEALPLNSLLPPVYELVKYYRYEGSLTTPDCHETVIWTVFEEPISLSLFQVSQFSTVHFGGTNSTFMSENFRPAQFLNNRPVYWSRASSLLPPAKVLVLVLILPYILNSL
ncbi:CAH4 anhydrase, partial [Odontophorus gujanensis]|nr:CAH4 anhydrase [Odontophorus gujanensis]